MIDRRGWTILAFGVWVWILGFVVPAILGRTIPPDRYIVLTTFVVEDTVEGQSPKVLSDRVIVRDHVRDIQVTIKGLDDQIGYICDRVTTNLPATAGSAFPPNMTLERFMGMERDAMPCRWMFPGDYTAEVSYSIHGPLGSRIRLVLPGADFKVHPAPNAPRE